MDNDPSRALVGYSGYVGSTLLGQTSFGHKYRSTDIAGIRNRHFDTLVCAGAPAQKWIANREPQADLEKINALIAHLATVTAGTFVLISTIDVFADPCGVDEDTGVQEPGLGPYGLHRRLLEKFVAEHFANHLIIRLPGLVGPGLRKNAIYDILHNNNLQAIDSRGVFQFYPMVNLWYDVQLALQAGLKLVHLTAEPLRIEDAALLGFGIPLRNHLPGPAASYDMRTRHAGLFGVTGHYQYSRRESLQAIRAYAQSGLASGPVAGAAKS